jgi:hypothetical protein
LTSFINVHLSNLWCAQEKEARHHEAIKNQAIVGASSLPVGETVAL